MVESIFITGLGGQGIVTLASLIADLAAGNDCRVSLFNAKGMAQRGGRVTAEIRYTPDHDDAFGPRIGAGEADIMIGMELGETAAALSFLRPGGLLLLADVAWVPARVKLEKLSYADRAVVESMFAARTKRILSAPAVNQAQNMFMLGLLVRHSGCFSDIKAEALIGGRLRAGLKAGLESFRRGYEYEDARS
jgi:Pyruvate/2-oxoacid:ferredoxin oxidoreductase gamma subunit